MLYYEKRGVKFMLKEIKQRQSIRIYHDTPVEDEKIESILRSAMQAPTARNSQSWRFIVISKREALDDMITLQPYTGMMKTAPCAIMVLGDREAIQPDEYLYVDASAAIENMLLEATHQGLGSCWCAIGPSPERIDNFRSYYHIEERLLPIAVVAIGYGNEQKPHVDRFDFSKISYIR